MPSPRAAGFLLVAATSLASAFLHAPAGAQEVLAGQLRHGFGRNKVHYTAFEWWVDEGGRVDLYYPAGAEELAGRARGYLESGYDHLEQLFGRAPSSRPRVLIYPGPHQFAQTNLYPGLLPPGVGGFAESARHRAAVPFDGDLERFRDVLVHELAHVFEYEIVTADADIGATQLAAPPAWVMEGLAEFAVGRWSHDGDRVLRDAVFSHRLIPLKALDAFWGTGDVYLAYQQSHSVMEYVAREFGSGSLPQLLHAWHGGADMDGVLQRVLRTDMKTLDERWSADLRRRLWPLLLRRDESAGLGEEVPLERKGPRSASSPQWSPGGDMLALVLSDGVERHVELVRIADGVTVLRVTTALRAGSYDQLGYGPRQVAWSPDGRWLAFVAPIGATDAVLVWDVYARRVARTLRFEELEAIQSLAWSPDSRQLAFAALRAGRMDIYLSRVDSGCLTALTDTPERDDFPAWSPDGLQLAYSSHRDGRFGLRVHDLEAGRVTDLATAGEATWPLWDPDGKHLFYVAHDQGVGDVVVRDLASGREERLTQGVLGVSAPSLSADGRRLALEVHRRGRGRIYVAPVPETLPGAAVRGRPPTALPGAEGSPAVASAPASRPVTACRGLEPLAQRAAAAGKTPAHDHRRRYRPELLFDGLAARMGVFDGYLASLVQLEMSDLLGNHNLTLATDYVGREGVSDGFNSILSYSYAGRRVPLRGTFLSWNQYFVPAGLPGEEGPGEPAVGRVREVGLLFGASYPIDTYRRLDFGYSFLQEERTVVWPRPRALGSATTHLVTAAFVHDSVVYGPLGPTTGRRYLMALGRALPLASGARSFTHLEVDYRRYVRAGPEVVLGLRFAGLSSTGRDRLTYLLGGPAWYLPFYGSYTLSLWPLRGHDPGELTGSHAGLLNVELRVPLVRDLVLAWPVTMAIPGLEGTLFADVGGAWDRLGAVRPWPLRDPGAAPGEQSGRLDASLGFGVMGRLPLPLSLQFARRTDLRRLSGWRVHLTLGRSF